jgi:hypothetical protein
MNSFLNNAYVVLSDKDTYDGVDNSWVFFLTEEGDEELSLSGGMKHVDHEKISHVVSIADLLEIYEMYVNNGHKFNGN